jgi:hypothetical protein
MDPQLSQRVGRLMSTPTITAIKRSTQQLMSFLSEVEGASSFEDLPPRTKIVILRAETEQRDIDDELRSLSTRHTRKYNTAHDAHGRFASTGSSPWHKSTEAPAGLTHANAVEREDAQAGLHITRGEDVNSTAVRGAAKDALVSQITARILRDPERLKAVMGDDLMTPAFAKKELNEPASTPDNHEIIQHYMANYHEDAVYQRVNRQVRQWADNSGDNDATSLSVQHAVAEEFGLHKQWNENVKRLTQAAQELEKTHYATHGASQRAIARTMYENTQEQLQKEGISSVTLYRGVKFIGGGAPKWTQYGRRRNIALQPISSFTPSVEIALRFSGTSSSSYSAHIIAMEVPRERIFSTARTGNGCLNEYEYVVLGGVSPGRNLKVGEQSDHLWSGKPTLKPPGAKGY